MDKKSKPYTGGEFDDLFEASSRTVMEPSEAIAYSDSYLRMQNFKHNLELIREESIKQGREEEKAANARKMLEFGATVEWVSKVTGLTESEVLSLK